MTRVFPAIVLLVLAFGTPAFAEDAQLAQLFTANGIQGTLVLASLDDTFSSTHNDTRAALPVLPASTFKILNTLIALDEAVITERDNLPWPGVDQGVPACNTSQNLQSAYRNSCVWFYQELARRIGPARYGAWLAKVHYGNARPTPEVTTFWLEGDLRISAREQVAFLKGLYNQAFPCKASSYEALKRIMVLEQTAEYTVRAKTGWAGFGSVTAPQLGWYVGYVETKKGVWFFALNVDLRGASDGPVRKKLVLEALKAKGII